MHWSVEDVRREVGRLLECEPESVPVDGNLIQHGLDSLRLMRLAGGWRRRGAEITFAELAERPTIAAWAELLAAATAPEEAAGEAAEAVAGEAPETAAEAADPSEPFPLAAMQHAYWVGRGDDQVLGGVAAHLYTEFDRPGGAAPLDPERLEAAVRTLAARHPALRTRITPDGRQQVLPEAVGPLLTVEDLRDLPAPHVAERLDAIRDACSHQMLDIEAGRVFDVRLTLLPDGATRLHVDVDMVAADALSFRILLADLARIYTEPGRELPPLEYDHRAYLADRPKLRAAAAERGRAHWDSRLADLPGAPDLPLRAEAERGDPTRVTRRHLWLSPEDKNRWLTRAHERSVTPAMALAAAFAHVLAAWSAEPHFLLNLPLFDREELHPDVPLLVGDFTGSVLLDTDLGAPASFLDTARGIQARLHEDAAHADRSGLDVLRDLARARGGQVVAPIVYTSALNLGELFAEDVRGLFGEPEWIISQGPQVLLDAQVTEVRGGLLVNWDIREELFAAGVADAMFEAYRELVTRLGTEDADWDRPVGDLLPAAQRRVRERANATAAPRGSYRLHDRFFALARSRPDTVAVVAGPDVRWTYAELADRALRVAAALGARGVRPGDTVAVTLPKGPEQILAVLGVLAAGAAYVPVGVEQPASRRARIHATAGARLVLDGDGASGASPHAEALALDEAAKHADALAAPVPSDARAAAYILFTSGSTGEPKGVEVPHSAAVNTIDDLIGRYALGPSDRTLALSALDFDLSVFDIFAPLAVGGAVVVPDADDRHEPSEWLRQLREHRISVLNCVPALLAMLLTAAEQGADQSAGPGPEQGGERLPDTLRVVLLGGDWVTADLPVRLHAQVPACRFVGLGGTTETAIHSTVYEVPPGAELPSWWRAVPYGRPLANVRCRVVDVLGRDRPDHVPGELWIGGEGVALGYRGDPGRTADRFVEHDGERWYRTGDLARYLGDGTLEFLGRRDHQVKLRGYRIELGEIEAALSDVPGVRQAVAGVVGSPGRALAAAVVGPAELTEEQILSAVRDMLPPHMIPEQVLVLAEMPLTRNGKTDRARLAALWEQGRGGTAHAAPRGPVEEAVAAVWRDVLAGAGTAPARIGRDDDFFALGGDSVLATAAVGRLREALDTDGLSVRALLGNRTVAALAARVVADEDTPGRTAAVAELYLQVSALTDDEVEAMLASDSPA
ncbi:amino acid adenylation domain-containing protein [Yinghuangia sp. YIM S09857]|uniref:non-ribosomal peptide synthetase n=1 Tax=Yinghuangia sp. YIM S09857 TaxID=3436929 RepID=UPI003F531B22